MDSASLFFVELSAAKIPHGERGPLLLRMPPEAETLQEVGGRVLGRYLVTPDSRDGLLEKATSDFRNV